MIPRKTTFQFFASFLLCISVCFHFGTSELLAIDCETDGVYNVNTTSGRTYRENLESLLEVLASNASRPNGFYNYTAGSTDVSVKGLFLCRGDLTASDCQACLADARPKILEICPNQTGAVIFYDTCILRFSNQSIFGRLDTGYKLYYWINQNVSDTTLLNQVLGDTFDQITSLAARDDVSGKKFAVQEARYTTFQKIYAMGQCTPDLSNLDCQSCLTSAISLLPSCCTSRPGGRVLFPSCNIRYDPAPFYRTLAPPPPPQPKTNPPPPPRPPSPGPGHASNQNNGRISTTTIAVIGILAVVIAALVVSLFCVVRKTRMLRTPDNAEEISGESSNISNNSETLLYSFIHVQNGTNNFGDENKIGRGGFGDVYKCTLPDRKVVAVKRLSRNSLQGEREFTNEIAVVAKLRHRNLVGLLGYCLQGEERILIYEYFANKSLDNFLFDPAKQPLLNWVMRYTIIKGIARGLVYLHQDCGLKIIHRDLKASNVLLDQHMSAKISDFGMARLFEIDQSERNTSKIAGTFGYMAPEYLHQGNLSVKSDVFSFGVLLLEIISGTAISNLQRFGTDNLPTYAWKQWRNETPLAVMDPAIGESFDRNEVTRCIQIGLLCVVEDVGRRPDMTSIAKMLDSDSIQLSNPDQPAYYGRCRTGSFPREATASTADSRMPALHIEASRNNVTITELYPR